MSKPAMASASLVCPGPLAVQLVSSTAGRDQSTAGTTRPWLLHTPTCVPSPKTAGDLARQASPGGVTTTIRLPMSSSLGMPRMRPSSAYRWAVAEGRRCETGNARFFRCHLRAQDIRQSSGYAAFNVSTLIIHETSDKTVPIDASGRAAAAGI